MNAEYLQRQAAIEALQAKYNTSHIFHLILSVLTAGLWIPVWILVTVSNSIERGKVKRAANHNELAGRAFGRFGARMAQQQD